MNPLIARRVLAVSAFVLSLLAILSVLPYSPAIAIAVILLAASVVF